MTLFLGARLLGVGRRADARAVAPRPALARSG
jgi:hypothetical protein